MFRLIQKLQKQSTGVRQNAAVFISAVVVVPIIIMWVAAFPARFVPTEPTIALPTVHKSSESPFVLLKEVTADIGDGFGVMYTTMKAQLGEVNDDFSRSEVDNKQR